MAALRTDDFMEMGRNHARGREPGMLEAPTPYARTNASWQARAYWAGFDAEAERIASSKRVAAAHRSAFDAAAGSPTGRAAVSDPDLQNLPGGIAAKMEMQMARTGTPFKTPLASRIDAEQAHWPEAVREHVRALSTAFANDPSNPRAARWGRSINRMYRRYGKGQQQGAAA